MLLPRYLLAVSCSLVLLACTQERSSAAEPAPKQNPPIATNDDPPPSSDDTTPVQNDDTGAIDLSASEGVTAAPPPEEKKKKTKIVMKPGVRVRVYLPKVPSEWPIDGKSLPGAPAEQGRLSAFPQITPKVELQGAVKYKNRVHVTGNTLVESKLGLLDGVSSYAVRFTGYIYAPTDGDYGFTIRSDDPILLHIEGAEVAKLDHSAAIPWKGQGVKFAHSSDDGEWTVAGPGAQTTAGHVTLTGGRYYKIDLMAYQRRNLPPDGAWSKEKSNHDTHSGGHLEAWMTPPDGETQALKVYTKEHEVVEE